MPLSSSLGFSTFHLHFLPVWLLGVQSVIAVSLSSWADRSDAPSSQPASFFMFSFNYSFFYPPYQVKCQTFSFFFPPSEPLSESQRTQHSPDLYCSAGTSQRCAFSSFILWHYSFNFFICEILVLFFKLPGFSLKHHHFFHNTPPGKFPYIVNILNGGGSNI